MRIDTGGTAIISGCTFKNNYAKHNGGAFFISELGKTK